MKTQLNEVKVEKKEEPRTVAGNISKGKNEEMEFFLGILGEFSLFIWRISLSIWRIKNEH